MSKHTILRRQKILRIFWQADNAIIVEWEGESRTTFIIDRRAGSDFGEKVGVECVVTLKKIMSEREPTRVKGERKWKTKN